MKKLTNKNSKKDIIRLNLDQELENIINKIDTEFLLYKCKQFNVKHSKYDSFSTLCKKFLNKNSKIKPWDMPDDNDGVAGFISPQFTLEHLAILYGYAREYHRYKQDSESEQLMNKTYKKLKETLKNFIMLYEHRQFLNYFKDELKKLKLRKGKVSF
ncbi:MAG TPA: hypothetical protein PLG90_02885 [Ignavibacteria bacterium]|nr:hypothetical protein [Ignavibacteria bacterium]